MKKMKLYVSDELLSKKGKESFKGLEYDDYKPYGVYGETVEVGNHLYLDRDDMDNLYLSLNQCEESFTNVEDL